MRLRWPMDPCPQCYEDIGVDGGNHCPRISRSHRRMFLFPHRMPGLPIPRYFENALLLRTGRIRTPLPSLSNNRRSPARTPRTRRTSRGTVMCPLLVILACFCTLSPPFLTSTQIPYSRISKLLISQHKLQDARNGPSTEPEIATPARGQPSLPAVFLPRSMLVASEGDDRASLNDTPNWGVRSLLLQMHPVSVPIS